MSVMNKTKKRKSHRTCSTESRNIRTEFFEFGNEVINDFEAVSLESWQQIVGARGDDVEAVSQQRWTPLSVSLTGKTWSKIGL